MSKQPNLPGTSAVKRKHNTEYPGRRCPHVVAHPLPHIKYQVEGLPGRRTIMRQTGLSHHSTGHSAARNIIGAHVKHGTDYAVFEDENGFGGFVPKPGTIPEGARLTKPNICQWALPTPVSTAVVHGNGSTFPPIITAPASTQPETVSTVATSAPIVVTQAQRALAKATVDRNINPNTFCYRAGVDDESLAAIHGLPVEVVTNYRMAAYGEPEPIDVQEFMLLRDDALSRAEAYLKIATDAESFAARMSAALLKLGV